MVSNLTAGSVEQVHAVCRSGLFPRLIQLMATEEYEIRKEVVHLA